MYCKRDSIPAHCDFSSLPILTHQGDIAMFLERTCTNHMPRYRPGKFRRDEDHEPIRMLLDLSTPPIVREQPLHGQNHPSGSFRAGCTIDWSPIPPHPRIFSSHNYMSCQDLNFFRDIALCLLRSHIVGLQNLARRSAIGKTLKPHMPAGRCPCRARTRPAEPSTVGQRG